MAKFMESSTFADSDFDLNCNIDSWQEKGPEVRVTNMTS